MATKVLAAEKSKRAWVHLNINVKAPETRDVLAVISTLLFGGAVLSPLYRSTFVIDPELKGAIITQWALVMGWYFGSSKSAAAKDATIADQAKTIAANPPTGAQ